MNKKRQDYLSQNWQPYPSARGRGICGRLVSVEPKTTGVEIGLFYQFEFQTIEIDSVEHITGHSWADLLIPGDLVSVEGRSLILLVASRAEPVSGSISFDKRRAQQWTSFIEKVKSFFLEKNFTEIATPSLVDSPGMETNLDSFKAELISDSSTVPIFLPTSPEFHLKKALCMGFGDIFEIAKAFRNNEYGSHHQNEFWMLEWYRSFNNLDAIKEDLVELIDLLCPDKSELVEVSVSQLFLDNFNFNLSPSTSSSELLELASELGLDSRGCTQFDDLFFLIFVDKIEPKLSDTDKLLIHSYPPSQAALARITDEGWADRFELYIQGVEIANAFHELNDPVEQKTRFEQAQKRMAENAKEITPYDSGLIAAMNWGMPPSGGIALGLDRLFMQIYTCNEIGETRLFPRA